MSDPAAAGLLASGGAVGSVDPAELRLLCRDAFDLAELRLLCRDVFGSAGLGLLFLLVGNLDIRAPEVGLRLETIDSAELRLLSRELVDSVESRLFDPGVGVGSVEPPWLFLFSAAAALFAAISAAFFCASVSFGSGLFAAAAAAAAFAFSSCCFTSFTIFSPSRLSILFSSLNF